MWANAQRDGRPAEYRWRPLLNVGVPWDAKIHKWIKKFVTLFS